MFLPKLKLVSILLLVVCASSVSAKEVEAKKDESVFKGLKYRMAGPNIGGRVTRVAGVVGDPLTAYAAFAQGGIWKTSDGGQQWLPIFDEQNTQSIGSIAVAPSDPNVIYAGGGEANIRGNAAHGTGIYKSNDAGKTWTHVWKQIGQIGTMAVHPSNPDIAYAAVLGHAFGANPERGVYRTIDGGATWQKVLYRDELAGASDVAIDPSNPRRVFAGFWQTRRTPWTMTSGGPGSGLFFSANEGKDWKELGEDNGLPAKPWGKVGVAVAPSDSRRVFAIIEAEKGGVYRSDDGGGSFSLVNDSREIRQRAWYYSTLNVDPNNANIVWAPQVNLLRSIDGGKTFQTVRGQSHGDHHDLWIDPNNSKRLINGHDGGIDLSNNGGESWWNPKLPVAQFYNIDADNRSPYHIGGTMQDMGTASGPSRNLLSGGVSSGEWLNVGGGEAGDFVYDLHDAGVIYAGEYSGYLSHYEESSSQLRNISPFPFNAIGHAAENLKYRIQWTAPIALSPHQAKTIYHGANVLFKSTNRGDSWQVISPDLTRNDKSKQQWSGGPITGDNTGVETYNTIFSIAESPTEAGVIWVGSDDGLVHITRNGGTDWSNITPKDMPEWGTVEGIEVSRYETGVAYVVVEARRVDDYRPHVWKVSDYGKRWSRIDKGLDAEVNTFSIREDATRQGLLYLGTETGVQVSFDDGKTWQALRLNMPAVPVTDLVVKHNDLIVGTRGRSIWILDDIGAIREHQNSIKDSSVHLYSTPAATRARIGSNASREAGTSNPGNGASITYWLKEKHKDELKLEILDASGKVVRTLSSKAKPSAFPNDGGERRAKGELTTDKGLNRVNWDLRVDGAKLLPKARLFGGNPESGPLALPGNYTLRLQVGDAKTQSTLAITADTRSTISAQDTQANYQFTVSLRDAVNRVVDQVEILRSIRDQATALKTLVEKREDAKALRETADAIVKSCDEIEGALHNRQAEITYDLLAQQGGTQLHSQLAYLYGAVTDSDHAPTQGMREQFQAQQAQLAALEKQSAELKAGPLAQLETQVAAIKLPRIILP